MVPTGATGATGVTGMTRSSPSSISPPDVDGRTTGAVASMASGEVEASAASRTGTAGMLPTAGAPDALAPDALVPGALENGAVCAGAVAAGTPARAAIPWVWLALTINANGDAPASTEATPCTDPRSPDAGSAMAPPDPPGLENRFVMVRSRVIDTLRLAQGARHASSHRDDRKRCARLIYV